jgi:hypothetical protein
VHILLLASLRGHVVRGPMTGAQHAYVLVRDWLGAPPGPLDRDIALAELARRYLAGHGPADDRDLARWAGLPLRDARRGLSAIAGELSQRDDGLADLAKRGAAGRTRVAGKQAGPAAAASASPGSASPGSACRESASPASAAPFTAGAQPAPRLLGPFDPLLLGWASRAPVLGGHQGVVTVNGLFRAFALVGGKAAATWSLSGGQLTLTPFAPLAAADEAALMADADDVLRFLGLPPRPARPGPATRGSPERHSA